MTYTELVVTVTGSMHPNIEFSHQIKVRYLLKANKADCIDESKHFVTNQYHPEHYGIYPMAGKYSGRQ